MRLSIRSRLIGTSALLVAFVVVLFAVVTNQMVREDLAEDELRVQEQRLGTMHETGLLLTQMTAQGALPLLASGSIPDLNSLISRLVERASSAGKVEIEWAAVYNDVDRIEALAPEAAGPPQFSPSTIGLETLRDVAEPHVYPITEEGGPSNFYVVAPVRAESFNYYGGAVVIEFGAGPLISELATLRSYTERRMAQLQRNTSILGGLAILLGIFIAIVQSLRITSPILRLAGTAEKIAAGDLETRATVKSKDEIGLLARSFNNMAERIRDLLREAAEKATLQKELEVARIIQETLLPPNGVVDRDPLDIYGYFRAASVCGGDFWHVVDLDDGRTLVVIGDVTGHGVPSAMISASAKASLDTVRNIRGKNLSLTFLLEEMNKTIFSAAKRKFVMTFCALAFDKTRAEVAFCNAGHNFPLLVRKDQGKVSIRGLIARGNRLGDVEESRYMEQRIAVRTGDLIVLYTDGLTEYRNNEGAEYSERRFRRVLQRSQKLNAEEVGKTVLRDLSKFAAQAPQEDDVSLVVIKVGQLQAA